MQLNASLLTLITISNEIEEVVFAYLKELDEEAPPSIHWYPSKGKNGKAELIWSDKKLKQWLAIGEDGTIKDLWKQLINSGKLDLNWTGVTQSFKIPPVIQKIKGDDFVAIEGICTCGRNDYPDEFECKSFDADLNFLIDEKNNCEFVSGYQYHNKIKPLFPPGLLGEGSLFNYLKNQVCAVYKKRGIHWQLKGDRAEISKNNDPKFFSGFIQATEDFKRSNLICIRNIEGNHILGEAEIDIKTGKWQMDLSEPIGKGQFLIKSKENDRFVCGEKFYLLKDIQINTHIVSTVLSDLYGRSISLSGEKEKINLQDTSIVWDVTAAPDTKQSEIELSDKLSDIILSLGKKIIFNDPYFWGDFKEEGSQLKDFSKSQYIFLNALITALAKGRIEELIIIGYWKRASELIEGDKDKFLNKYRLLSQIFKKIFNDSFVFKLNKFKLVFSNEPFHDRYWLGIENNIIYHVSNSINGAFESGELRIVKLDNLNTLKIKPRVSKRLENGDKLDLL